LKLQVNANGTLASIEALEVSVQRHLARHGSTPATEIGRIGPLDLYDVRAKVGEHRGRVSPLLENSHVEDANAFQRERHSNLLANRRRVCLTRTRRSCGRRPSLSIGDERNVESKAGYPESVFGWMRVSPTGSETICTSGED